MNDIMLDEYGEGKAAIDDAMQKALGAISGRRLRAAERRVEEAYSRGEDPDDTDAMLLALYVVLYAVAKERGVVMKRIGWTKMGDRDWYHASFGRLTYDYDHEVWRSSKYEVLFGTLDRAMRMLPKIAYALDEVPQ